MQNLVVAQGLVVLNPHGDGAHPILLGGVILFVAGMCVGSIVLDKSRIRSSARAKGWVPEGVTWVPFGSTDRHDRCYLLRYLDRDGKRLFVYCTTSLFSGVNWRTPCRINPHERC